MAPPLAFLFSLYFACSSLMLIANKLAFTALPAPGLVTSIQYLFSAAAVVALALCGAVHADLKVNYAIVRTYGVVPLLFALAIFANGKLLETANVETFLVFRFSTPLTVGLADFMVLGKELPSLRTCASLVLIVAGAVAYGLSDEGFRLDSYLWATMYVLVITVEMILVKHVFTVHEMSTWTRVYLNNLLSLPFQPLFILGTQEQLRYGDLILSADSLGYVVLSSVLGLALAWAGVAFRAEVTATTCADGSCWPRRSAHAACSLGGLLWHRFTFVGVVCKIVTISINVLMWDKHASPFGLGALLLCLAGSALYQPSADRSAGSTRSKRVWHVMDQGCCGLLSLVDLSAKNDSKPQKAEYARVAQSDSQVMVDAEQLGGKAGAELAGEGQGSKAQA